MNDNLPLGPPLRGKKEEEPGEKDWVDTDRPGIQRNTKTGKLRTVDVTPDEAQ